VERVTAPWWPVAGASALALAAIALALVNWLLLGEVSIPLLAAGYVLGAMGPTVLASVYRALRNSRRRHPRFRVQPGLDRTAVTVMAVGVAAGLANAVLLATELAK
jgi:hypothetical protein